MPTCENYKTFASSSIKTCIIAWFVRVIWHKYHSWYFKIVSPFPSSYFELLPVLSLTSEANPSYCLRGVNRVWIWSPRVWCKGSSAKHVSSTPGDSTDITVKIKTGASSNSLLAEKKDKVICSSLIWRSLLRDHRLLWGSTFTSVRDYERSRRNSRGKKEISSRGL